MGKKNRTKTVKRAVKDEEEEVPSLVEEIVEEVAHGEDKAESVLIEEN